MDATASKSASAPGSASSISQAYQTMVKQGEIEEDPAQVELVRLLDAKIAEIHNSRLSSKTSSLGWLFHRSKSKANSQIKGLYIWGSVGRGKSMLMDMFFARISKKSKRRAHFNDFMSDAHDRIHQQRQDFKNGITKEEDPIPPVAKALAKEAQILCFDEFAVTDIADAMILGRLFETMFKQGVVVIATSNVAPDDLYRDGLNRQLFLPFIEQLKQRLDEFELDARTDFRLEKHERLPVYLSPINDKNKLAMDRAWEQLTGTKTGKPEILPIKGRTLKVPKAVDDVARFDFSDLCDNPLGALDYLVIARRYHTVLIDNVPMMDQSKRNQAKRFILLIDTLYDNKRRLILSAAANPHALYQSTTGTEAFEFDRTASRLIEMQSRDYLETLP